jgi:hypothetical protein
MLILLSMSFIFAIPIYSITFSLSNFGRINEDFNYNYSLANSSSLNRLNLECDIGNIEIDYIYPPLDDLIGIKLIIEMAGYNLAKKSYSDYFTIYFNNESSSVNFSLKIKSDLNQIELLPLIKNITIIVKIRTDAIINIEANIRHGDVHVLAPFGAEVKNMRFNITEGNLFTEFINCVIGGNITGLCSIGDITFKTYDVKFRQNIGLGFVNDEGTILFEIIQIRKMEANITGSAKTNNGEIRICYQDYSSDIGAIFIFYNYSGGWSMPILNNWSGFPQDPESFYDDPDVGYIFKSFDFPAQNNYNLSLYKNSGLSETRYYVNITSI